MEGAVPGKLVGSEIHGFQTLHDLDISTMLEEAKTRWLRPNEIHAVLYNYKHFNINVKPVTLPTSGTIVLFDRKMLRNFRKDGHNWKKKKDGKTVKEAHEHLKVGNEERIHVYYAHGEDNPTFVRRCYWLLDKALEHIVLVHYRETQEVQGPPATPVNSNSSSVSDPTSPWLVAEEIGTGGGGTKASLGPGDSRIIRNHEMRLHEINTLEWDELLATADPFNPAAPNSGDISYFNQHHQTRFNGFLNNGTHHSAYGDICGQIVGVEKDQSAQNRSSVAVGTGESLDILVNDGLQSQDSFGMWINNIISDSPGSVDDPALDPSVSPGLDYLTSAPEQIFTITDVSPAWAYSTEKTKILVTGLFHEGYLHLEKSNLFCVCGNVSVPAEILQVGVYRCILSPHSSRIENLYMSCDGQKPISQVLKFEYRAALLHETEVTQEEQLKLEEFQLQMRLAYLLFSTSKNLEVLASKVSLSALSEAKKFANKTSHISNSWAHLMKMVQDIQISYAQAKENLIELTLKNRVKEWLLEKIFEGCKTTELDGKGQGVIHLCAILGYTWAVYLFLWSGLSLDFRDKHGWTALHWAAYYGREKMVAVLLSAGARPNLVTDPTSENLGGRTAADLASKKGYDGLAAYLSEKSLVAQFEDMKIAGNISGSLPSSTAGTTNPENLTEEEQSLKDTLAAYRTAAEAASRIQVAFREHSLKVQTNAVHFTNPEEEARDIVAAMKIQHAFRNYETHKKMVAAARIQHRFHAWKMRREFLNMRRQAVRIQAAFRGFQVRRQYRKIIWSVGVLEKAILRWRLKRKGFRGLQVDIPRANEGQGQSSDTEEDFYKASQKQAEDRLERSVVRVQAMFRSKKAQRDYRRMKLEHEQAQREYDGLQELDNAMET